MDSIKVEEQSNEATLPQRMVMIEKDGHRYLVPANYETPKKQQEQKVSEPK